MPEIPPRSEFISVNETAARFNVHRDTVRRWINSGQLPAITLPSGRRKLRATDVDAFIPAA